MKKAVLMLFALMLAVAGFGQDLTPVVDSVPWYTSTEFWITIAGAALIVIEWILRIVPTSKPAKFILSAIVYFLKWIIERVPQKVKK